jgi:broad specificity phosphatase PhoE
MKRAAVAILIVMLLVAAGSVAAQTTTVLVVRHAEKVTETGKDPELTAEGRARAENLAAMLKDVEVAAIYSTPFKRTVDTGAPVAREKGLEITLTEASRGFVAALAERILSESLGRTVLVVGHSNTVGPTLAALGCGEPFELDESEYGDLFVCTLPDSGRPSVLRLKF